MPPNTAQVQNRDQQLAQLIAQAASTGAAHGVRAAVQELKKSGGLGEAPDDPANRDPLAKIPPGPLMQYYNDLASGVIKPEDMRIEALEYRCQINAAGQVTFQTDTKQLISSYTFTLRRIYGWVMDPATVGPAASLVTFQLKEMGRNFEYFKTPVSLSDMVGPQGTTNPMIWDGTYINIPGSQLGVEWSVDATRWPVLVGTFKEFGVKITGDYVSCSRWG